MDNVTWEQGKDPKDGAYNRFKFNQPLTEYSDGAETKDGKKTAQRHHEMGDPISTDGNPFGDMMIDQ